MFKYFNLFTSIIYSILCFVWSVKIVVDIYDAHLATVPRKANPRQTLRRGPAWSKSVFRPCW